MVWVKRNVTDQNVEFPNRFKIDGESKIIEPDFGTIVDPGTPINRQYLQPIEDYLEIVDTHLNDNATLETLGHVKRGVLTTTLNTTWSGSSAPFTKTQTVTGILATDTPIVDVIMSGTYATDETRQEAWNNIYRITTANNSITLYAKEKPTVDLPIQLKVVR